MIWTQEIYFKNSIVRLWSYLCFSPKHTRDIMKIKLHSHFLDSSKHYKLTLRRVECWEAEQVVLDRPGSRVVVPRYLSHFHLHTRQVDMQWDQTGTLRDQSKIWNWSAHYGTCWTHTCNVYLGYETWSCSIGLTKNFQHVFFFISYVQICFSTVFIYFRFLTFTCNIDTILQRS